MSLTDKELIRYKRRLLMSRMRILCDHGFYGLLLMHMKFAIDESCKTAATDGDQILFNPGFMDEIVDKELDFVLMHEILHVVLRHCVRDNGRDPELFNIACDIVVNSNILKDNNMDLSSITLKKYGESMHLTPDGEEGYEYTAEQVYELVSAAFPNKKNLNVSLQSAMGSGQSGTVDRAARSNGIGGNDVYQANWDDHTRWIDSSQDNRHNEDLWNERLRNACEAISVQKSSTGRGTIPLCAKRKLDELMQSKTDWRTILTDFIQEEIVDYSFNPPDRRFDDSPFFLPDFNETEEQVKDILFMIDTSGSMSDKEITQAYSEVKGAIDQFNGKLQGWLGFFDAKVVKPKRFESQEEFEIIRPEGGGGTSFDVVFDYIRKHMEDELPVSIIILTDGCAPFPDESKALGIPVLWMINNDEVDPPWGKVARIQVKKDDM